MLNQRSDKMELLRIAEAVAIEKSIDKEIIYQFNGVSNTKGSKNKIWIRKWYTREN